MTTSDIISSVSIEPDTGASIVVAEITLTAGVRALLRADSASIPAATNPV